MIILDTDIWTIQQHARGEAFERLAARLLRATDPDVAITVVSVQEQLRGWLAYLSQADEIAKLTRGYDRLREWVVRAGQAHIVSYDEHAASEFGRFRSIGVRIGTMDLRIAAIAIAHGALLVSRNLRDFEQVPGLRVEDWTR